MDRRVKGTTVFPAAVTCMRKLKDLQLYGLGDSEFEAGWAHLPALHSLVVHQCDMQDCELLPGPGELFWVVQALAALRHLERHSCSTLSLPAGLSGLTLLSLRET